MRNQRVYPTKPELIALILSLTFATVVSYALNSSLSETESGDWNSWLEISPQVVVLMTFGAFASHWRKLFVYTGVAVGVNLIFVVSSYIFEPAAYAEMVDLYFGSPVIFWTTAIVSLAVFSFLLLTLAFSLRRLAQFVLRRVRSE